MRGGTAGAGAARAARPAGMVGAMLLVVAAAGGTPHAGRPASAADVRVTPSSQSAARAPEAAAACASDVDPDTVEMSPGQAAPGARGHVELTMPESPYGLTVSLAGSYVYDVQVRVRRLRRRPGRTYVAWATTPELDAVKKLGVLGEDGRASGTVDWNKFLVVVTEESSGGSERWQGPVMLTALSPSGLMHTMRGHGIFEAHGIGC